MQKIKQVTFGMVQYAVFLMITVVNSGVLLAVSEPIILGQSAAFSGPSEGLGIELWEGANAYFEKINKAGGVQGRPIKVLALDDAYNGELTLANTQKLLRDQNLFALFGFVGTPTLVKALPLIQYYSTRGAFLFSNFTGAEPQRTFPYKSFVFNVRASYREETLAIVKHFQKKGLFRIGLFIQDDSYGRSGAHGVEKAISHLGKKSQIIVETTYHRGSKFEAAYFSQVQLLKKAQVDAVVSVGAYAACAGFIRDARKLGLKVPIANVSFVGSLALLKLLKPFAFQGNNDILKDLFVSQVVPVFNDDSYPLVREFMLDMKEKSRESDLNILNLKNKRYHSDELTFSKLEGYLNAKLLIEILKQVKGPLNAPAFIKTAENMHEVDVGLHKKIRFSKSDHQALHEVYLTEVIDGHFKLVKDAFENHDLQAKEPGSWP